MILSSAQEESTVKNTQTWVSGLRFVGQELGFRVLDLGFKVLDLGFRV